MASRTFFLVCPSSHHEGQLGTLKIPSGPRPSIPKAFLPVKGKHFQGRKRGYRALIFIIRQGKQIFPLRSFDLGEAVPAGRGGLPGAARGQNSPDGSQTPVLGASGGLLPGPGLLPTSPQGPPSLTLGGAQSPTPTEDLNCHGEIDSLCSGSPWASWATVSDSAQASCR